MGFFGGDNEQPDNRANDLIEQQMRQNDIEIEQKRRSLVQTRLEVVKAQGQQQWISSPESMGAGYRQPRGRQGGSSGFGNVAAGIGEKFIKAAGQSMGKQ